jgi:hypothetical protein
VPDKTIEKSENEMETLHGSDNESLFFCLFCAHRMGVAPTCRVLDTHVDGGDII